MIFSNVKFDKESFPEIDLFICTISYEERSYYIFDQLSGKINENNALFLATDNYKNFDVASKKIQELQNGNFEVHFVNYQDNEQALKIIKNSVEAVMGKVKAISIHIDYSSMPRGWYCRLPLLLKNILRTEDRLFFWYSEGQYTKSFENYPTAGIDSFVLFSGKPALFSKHRVHVIGLGYDAIRSQGIISIIDPESTILIEAHEPSRTDIYNNVIEANKRIVSQASMTVSLELPDFSFMVSKLCEVAYEYIDVAEVIYVPDGPKPLIFAMSLVPDLVRLPGVSCLNFTRNISQFTPVNVVASGKVIGFTIGF